MAHHPDYFRRVMVSNTALNLMPEPVLNIPLNINREEYPVDPDSTVRTFDDFLKVCQEKGYIPIMSGAIARYPAAVITGIIFL